MSENPPYAGRNVELIDVLSGEIGNLDYNLHSDDQDDGHGTGDMGRHYLQKQHYQTTTKFVI